MDGFTDGTCVSEGSSLGTVDGTFDDDGAIDGS